MKRVAVVTIAFAACCAAMAGYTTVLGPASGEASHAQILNWTYGSSFLPVGTSPDYSNGTIYAKRINDWTSGTRTTYTNQYNKYFDRWAYGTPGFDLQVCCTNFTDANTDQVWFDGLLTTRARARYAGYQQRFGYDNTSGTGFVKVFDVTGSGYLSAPWANITPFSRFTWARTGKSGSYVGNPHWSREWLNPDDYPSSPGVGLDHMVTYFISGTNITRPTWLLFFEDENYNGQYEDWDFNDLVVEIDCIPAPAAAMLGVIGLGLVGWVKRRLS